MKNILKTVFFVLVTSLSLSSCDELENSLPGPVHLEVSVYGALSAEPREGVKVSIYETEEDALEKTNKITHDFTNSDGKVWFYDLEENKTYWVRANTILGINRTIREIHTYNLQNQLNLPVL